MSVILFGTLGYVFLEGAGFLDAMYMTIITVASVGYEETVDLDQKGRVFTMILILAGLLTWTLFTVNLVAFLVEGEFRRLFLHARAMKRISRMKNHYVICGLGQVGTSALEEFMAIGVPCVVVEKDTRVIEDVKEKYPELLVIHGDATNDETLEAANVQKARGLMAAAESDADNLFIVLSSRAKNRDLVIVSRATRTQSRDKLLYAGANHVVMPNVTGGMRMASQMLRPQVCDFLDVMMTGTKEILRIEQAVIDKSSPLAGMTLVDACIPQKTGLLVLAILHKDGTFVYNPTSMEKILAEDTLVVLGRADQMPALGKLIGSRSEASR